MSYVGEEIGKLGFGLMRLPKIERTEEFDLEQIKQMVDAFLEAGFTYFDTAWAYQGSEEAIRQQQRNFFVAYANLWRLKYTDDYAEDMVSSDEHSQSKERINGVVTNIDAWYDLFNVKPTDKMYLAPEKRIRIW